MWQYITVGYWSWSLWPTAHLPHKNHPLCFLWQNETKIIYHNKCSFSSIQFLFNFLKPIFITNYSETIMDIIFHCRNGFAPLHQKVVKKNDRYHSFVFEFKFSFFRHITTLTSRVFYIEASIAVISALKCVSDLRVGSTRLVSVRGWHFDNTRTYRLIFWYRSCVLGSREYRGVIIDVLNKYVHIRWDISLQHYKALCSL